MSENKSQKIKSCTNTFPDQIVTNTTHTKQIQMPKTQKEVNHCRKSILKTRQAFRHVIKQ